jgi:nicotinamide-nucleotide amidase
MNSDIYQLSAQIGEVLGAQGAIVTFAESCTGGGVAHAITAVPGSSAWFGSGFVTYANSAKHRMLGVSAELLNSEGAVSEPVVIQMARGAIAAAGADFGAAISGIAGPGGGSADKPVGTVWLCWTGPWGDLTQKHCFYGDRDAVRDQAITICLKQLLHQVTGYYTV